MHPKQCAEKIPWKFPSIVELVFFVVKLVVVYAMIFGISSAGKDGTITNEVEAFQWFSGIFSFFLSLALCAKFCAMCGVFKGPWKVRLRAVAIVYLPFGALAFYLYTL